MQVLPDCADICQVIHWHRVRSMSGKVVGVVEMEDLQRLFVSGKVGLHCTITSYVLNYDSCRRNLLFKSFLCYSHDIADVACKCCVNARTREYN